MNFERFTDRARKVVELARQHAALRGHDAIGSEHLFLGLLQEGSGVAASVLRDLGADPGRLRDEVEAILGEPGAGGGGADGLPFSGALTRVLDRAREASEELGHHYVGTEHLALGILAEGTSRAAALLRGAGVYPSRFRKGLREFLGPDLPLSGIPPRDPEPEAPLDTVPREKSALARRALARRLYAVAVRLFEEAFAGHPPLAAGYANGNRMRAVVAAVLAGLGEGDGADLPSARRAELHRKARAWLAAERDAWKAALASGRAHRHHLADMLAAWNRDQILTRVRTPEGLESLPAAERDSWKSLWMEFEDLALERPGGGGGSPSP